MIPIDVRDGLLYISLIILCKDKSLNLQNVLLDTGSHSTIVATDSVSILGLEPDPADRVNRVYGVGGAETVIEKRVDGITLDGVVVPDFTVQLGALYYGVPMDAIVGFDLLTAARAVIDLVALTVVSN